MKSKIAVLIPIHKELTSHTSDERALLEQTKKVFKDRPLFLFGPDSLASSFRLEEPFEFEKDIHKKLPEDTPDLHEICSYQIPHRYLIKIWEILNETHSYPYLIEPLE